MTRIFQRHLNFLFFFLLFNWYHVTNAQEDFDADDLSLMPDSLIGVSNSDKVLSKVDSLPNQYKKIDLALEAKIDSLKALTLPPETYAQKLDSLQLKYSQGANTKVLPGLRENSVDKLEGNIERKLQEKTQINNIALPSTETPKTDIPDAVDIDMPGIPNIEVGKAGDAGLDDATLKIDKAKGLPNEKIDNLHNTSQVKEATQGLEEVNEYTSQVEAYKKDWTEAKKGNLEGVEKRAEKEVVENFEEIGNVQQQAEEIKQGLTHQTDQKQYQAYVKQQMKVKAFDRVSKAFSGNSKKIADAQKELRKYKKKYARVQALKSNPLKDELFIERIVIGLQLEVLRNKATSLDFAPGFGYKVTRQLTIQGAYMYRFLFDNKKKSFQWQHPTYGPRFSANYMIPKGFFGSVSYELLRTNVPRNTIPEEATREWVYGGFVSVGKAHSIAPLLKGNLQVMYNFLYSDHSPYPNKINVRLGFAFGYKKKQQND